jgi:hypothetical protein
MEGSTVLSSVPIVAVLHAISSGGINIGISIISTKTIITIIIIITNRTYGIQIVLVIHPHAYWQCLPIGTIQDEQPLLGHFEDPSYR